MIFWPKPSLKNSTGRKRRPEFTRQFWERKKSIKSFWLTSRPLAGLPDQTQLHTQALFPMFATYSLKQKKPAPGDTKPADFLLTSKAEGSRPAKAREGNKLRWVF